MILWRVRDIEDRPRSIDKIVMQLVGYCVQVRVKCACEPIFQPLNHLEKAYASLNYNAIDRRLVVVRTNMGLCLRETDTSTDNGEVL